jgi:hypothetical protein
MKWTNTPKQPGPERVFKKVNSDIQIRYHHTYVVYVPGRNNSSFRHDVCLSC